MRWAQVSKIFVLEDSVASEKCLMLMLSENDFADLGEAMASRATASRCQCRFGKY